MNFEHHWNSVKIQMDEYGFLSEPGLIYTEGLGPCIGICIAYNDWAGVIHSSHPPHDEEEIGALIDEAKKQIPAEKLSLVSPVLCGSDPDGGEDASEDYELTRFEARKKAVELLHEAGFGEACVHWSEAGETAAIFADLIDGKIYVEIDDNYIEHLILQN